MDKIGTITKILNTEYLLASLNQDLPPGTELVVYQQFNLDPQQSSELKLDEILYPKGKVVLISKQKDNIYLLSTKIKRIRREREVNLGSAAILSRIYNYYDVENEESYAELDTTDSLDLDFNKKVNEGDILVLN